MTFGRKKKKRERLLFENKPDGQNDEDKPDEVIPFEFFFEIDDEKNTKHDKSDDLLDGLELGGGESRSIDFIF